MQLRVAAYGNLIPSEIPTNYLLVIHPLPPCLKPYPTPDVKF